MKIYTPLKIFIIANLCLLPIKTIFANSTTAPPPTNATDQELANYYQDLAQKYQKIAKQYQIKANLNKKNQPQVATTTTKITKIKQAFADTYAGVGFVKNTGDVNSYNLYAKAFVRYQPSDPNITTLTSTYQNAYEQGKGQLDDNLFADLNSIHNVDDKQGIYGDINYTRNTFSGYDYISNESVGYNRNLYDNDKLKINAQIGPGINQQKIQGGPGATELSAYFKLSSQYNINQQTNWQEIWTTTSTRLNTVYTLDSNITTNLWDQFALQFDIYINDTTHPANGKTSLNTTTTISILYTF